VGSSLACYPNYLSYANEASGGPGNLYRLLPNTDSGQSYWQVKQYMDEHPGTPCYVGTIYFVRPVSYGVSCPPIGLLYIDPLPTTLRGIVFVSSTQAILEEYPGGPFAGFRGLEPKARLGGSAMLVYEGEFDGRAAAARMLYRRAIVLFGLGRSREALEDSESALALAPNSAVAHCVHSGAMVRLGGDPKQAMEEATVAWHLALTDPHQAEALEATEEVMRDIARTWGVPLPDGVKAEAGR